MKRHLVSFASVVALLATVRPASAAKCQDIPLRVTIYTQALDESTNTWLTAAILPDGNGQYTDGVNVSAAIKVCSGTYDAVLNVGGSRSRTFILAFPTPIPGSIIDPTAPPAWVPGTYAVSGAERWINVRNLTFSKQPFATMAGTTFGIPGDKATYRLGFKGQSATLPNAPNLHDPDNTSGDNIPFASSPVVVYPNYPVVCGTGSMPTWLVRATGPNSPDTQLQVGTLHKKASTPQSTEVHEGQYSMPFEMFIEALKCFPY
jgi:hypothetical protein